VYVKASSRKTKDGQVIRYLQLAHNEWDSQAGISRTKVLHSFGREDELDREGIKRLVGALSRLLDPAAALGASMPGELELTSSRPIGGTYVLDELWHRLGIDQVIHRQLAGRKLDPRVERVLFALVANRALAASSKLAAAGWIAGDVHIEGLEHIDEQSCYRAMDYLLAIEPQLAEEAYRQVTGLLDLEVDLLFFGTRPPPTSRPGRLTSRSRAIRTGGVSKRTAIRRPGRSDSAPTASPRTPATICRR
jgi:hypothetical protein